MCDFGPIGGCPAAHLDSETCFDMGWPVSPGIGEGYRHGRKPQNQRDRRAFVAKTKGAQAIRPGPDQ